MSTVEQYQHLFIGWDVGGWNCDSNGKSRDSLVVFDGAGERIGQPWRGNLRETINAAPSARVFATRSALT